MRTYETMFIVHPDKVGDEHTALIEKFQTILKDKGADILKVEDWGGRKLAYPIRKSTRGNYLLFYFQASPGTIAEFERRLRLDDAILRFQTIVHEQEPDGLSEPEEQEEGSAETEGAGESAAGKETAEAAEKE